MNIFEKIRLLAARSRVDEEALYKIVLQEMEQGIRRDGLWAKAFSESAGELQKTKAAYIKYRVMSLKDEIALSSTIESSKPQSSTPSSPIDTKSSLSHEPDESLRDEIDELIAILAEGDRHEHVYDMVSKLINEGYDKESLVDLVADRGYYELARNLSQLIGQ